ncbi:MAG: hypothetical protein K0S70_3904 [Microbacterium sp.]|nr:hypothetical protein [Microbacterium sp.]
MNEELTPDERAAMRSRIVGGARDIKPAGAHRNAWIAGSIAAGAVATSTLSAPQIANMPSPTVTATTVPTPTPTSTPTSIPTQTTPVVAFGGDCSAVLGDPEVSDILGVPMTGVPVITGDARVLGGISCEWRALDSADFTSMSVTVVPWADIPDSVRQDVGVVPECPVGFTCSYSERHGDAWVSAEATDASEAIAAVKAVGSRAADAPLSARTLPATAWSIPDCDGVVIEAVRSALTRDVSKTTGTDYFPHGPVWDVMTSNGAAGWCDFFGPEDDGQAFFSLDVTFWPGASLDPAGAIARGEQQVSLTGATSAWMLPASDLGGGRVDAEAPGGSGDPHRRQAGRRGDACRGGGPAGANGAVTRVDPVAYRTAGSPRTCPRAV